METERCLFIFRSDNGDHGRKKSDFTTTKKEIIMIIIIIRRRRRRRKRRFKYVKKQTANT